MSLEKSGETKKRKLTPKQEKFCQNIAKGMTGAEAYKKAYNPPTMSKNSIWVEATRTSKVPSVSLRIKELQKQAEEEVKYTVKDSFLNLESAQSKAMEDGNINAYLKAEELKGRLVGLYTEKKEVDVGVKAIQVIFDENCKDL